MLISAVFMTEIKDELLDNEINPEGVFVRELF